MAKLNTEKIKQDFPIFNQKINDETLVYLDNAATSQIPKFVEEKVRDFNEKERANVHRGVHALGLRATNQYESSRQKVANFIGANNAKEVIFTSGCTDSLNLVAASFGEQNIQAGDEILVSIMEHHSNLLPWQQLAKRKQAKLNFIEINSDGLLDIENLKSKISSKTKIVALTHVSNVLGTINPIKELTDLAHEKGAIVVVDGAQAVGHFPIDVAELNVDFYAFSGHKMFAPTGIGVLYGKKDLLDKMPPYRLGGEMIANVTREGATWAEVPYKFEAGTPNIAGAIGLGAAIDYLQSLDFELIQKHEQELTSYALEKLKNVLGLTIYGPQKSNGRIGVISFNLKNIHPHDLATALDLDGIEVRAGHHCAQPLMASLNTESTVRASLSIYNTKDDIDKLVSSLHEAKEFFSEFR
ncbi:MULTISPECIES: aminotransferase class V-fold PLP-dependent enzyme [Lactobacillus]|jgi:cysteine desulfurase/selenocysteine lyase|uniref:Cysteine desulfurase n=1 Tax=Lactobacillus johnsonii TaxID=33959 RepID=A0AAW5LQB6_LACJH|nr:MULTISPECIES: cysteine desulfurase [Lactobacillus]MBU5318030.1 cysteine desulfurase [Lactobacillus johnsonii]MCR1914092.1 cysteine desulfurase [Lactobacillus johnsonii]PJN78703.1 cysteine desulfurase [Lactobacillus johnsonii]TGA94576.1 cysteine desulfurase [Lactobacillus johnsonii]TWU80548.1 putative cysteine desulfurase [Lactobacillus johnsonii]